MATLEDLITSASPKQGPGGASIESLMAGAGLSPSKDAPAAAAKPSTRGERLLTGFNDPMVGIGQIAQHVLPEAISNKLRESVSGPTLMSAVEQTVPGVGQAMHFLGGALKSAGGGTTAEVDQAIAERERAYQAGRAAAGSTGIDWMRTAGFVANPLNYAASPGRAATVAGRIGSGALAGAAGAATQPVTTPGNFLGGKGLQVGTGAVVGSLMSGAIEALSRPLSKVAELLRGKLKGDQADAAAQGAIDEVLQPAGITTKDLPAEMVDGVKEQVKHAMETGGEVNPGALRAQAEAASLPIPIKLPRGQASGNPMEYAMEQNLSKVSGRGEPLAQLFSENNQKLIDNLDAFGAKDAPSAAEAGKTALTSLAQIDKALDQAKNAAYAAVKDSRGRSATLDVDSFYTRAEDALKEHMADTALPAQIRQHLDEIAEGKLPLTVDTMVKLDKAWGRTQRTTADGNAAYAIGLVRRIMNDTPISGDMGAEAAQAYRFAKGLARQQFELADPASQSFVPAYAAMLKGMGNASQDDFIAALEQGTSNIDPEKFFTQQFMRGTPGGAKKVLGLLSQHDPDVIPIVQSGTMGAIRDTVVKGNDEIGRATFSSDALSKLVNKGELLRSILPEQTVGGLERLSRTATRIQRAPYNSGVNWSNTAAASANLQTLKEAGKQAATAVAEATGPVGRLAIAGGEKIADLSKRRAAAQAAQDATRPLYATQGAAVSPAKQAAYRAAVPLSVLMGAKERDDE